MGNQMNLVLEQASFVVTKVIREGAAMMMDLSRYLSLLLVIVLGNVGWAVYGDLGSETRMLDQILDRSFEIGKTSYTERLEYLESQLDTVGGFHLNLRLRFAIERSQAYFLLLEPEKAQEVLAGALSLSVDGLDEEALQRAESLSALCHGLAYFLKEDYKNAVIEIEKPLSYFRKMSDLEMQAIVLGWLGEVQYICGAYDRGYDAFQEAAKIYDMVGNRSAMAMMLLRAGTSGVPLALEDAMSQTLRVLKIFEEEGNLSGQAAVYQNMGYDSAVEDKDSVKFFKKSIELSRQVGDYELLIGAIAGLAETFVGMGRIDEAVATIDEGFELLADTRGQDLLAHLSRVAGVVFTAVGTDRSFARAAEYFQRAHEYYVSKGGDELVMAVEEGMAALELKRGNDEEALRLATEITTWYRAHASSYLPRGLLLLKQTYEKLGRWQEAMLASDEYWSILEHEWDSGLAAKMESLRRDYDEALSQSEIDLLEKENQLKVERITRLEFEKNQAYKTKMMSLLLVLALFLIVMVLVLLMEILRRNMRRSKATSCMLETQNRDLQDANERLKVVYEQRKSLLGMAAHDLKNPLASVDSLLEMMGHDMEALRDDKQYAQSLEMLDLSKQSVSYMKELIQKLLSSQVADFKGEHLHLEQVDMSTVVKQMLALNLTAAKRKSITIESGLIPFVPVLADSQSLKEVVDNLLSNAVKYTPHGGVVTVDVRVDVDLKSVALVVADSGPGIPEAEHDLLFQPFADLSPVPTGGESSNGLGLNIAKTLAEAMGGALTFANGAKGGAEFTLTLPIVEASYFLQKMNLK